MNILTIVSQIFVLVMAIFAVTCCIILYRHRHQFAWLLVSAVFLEPFVTVLIRAFEGRPLLRHARTLPSTDGAIHVHQYFEFPVFYLLAVIGVFLLARSAHRNSSNESVMEIERNR
jgi:hypothetical protein